MKVNVRQLTGKFDRGYALDKHTISSTPNGYYENGRQKYDTVRTDAGEAVYQLKYRQKRVHILPLAQAVAANIVPLLPRFGMVIPMAASNPRVEQPVTAVANALGQLINKPVFEILSKVPGSQKLKDLYLRSEKDAALAGTLSLNRLITNDGLWNALLIDDLHHSGASIDAACEVLRTYEKIGQIYIAALTWR